MTTGPLAGLVRGALAGAAGTTALNAVTYADMAWRGRPASSTPEKTVQAAAHRADVEVPGDQQTAQNRVSGIGPLLGIATGVGVGAALGAVSAWWRPPLLVSAGLAMLGATVGSIAPMAGLGVTDPASWSAEDWAADAVPHGAYGLVTALTLRLTE